MNLPPQSLLLTFALSAFVLNGCSPSPDQETPPPSEPASEFIPPPQARPDKSTSRDSLDWDGTYRGKGRTLTLTREGTFTLVLEGAQPVAGDFEWSGDGSTVILIGVGEEPARFLVGENVLIELDAEGQPVGGDPEAGRLQKTAPTEADPAGAAAGPGIFGKRWVLIELRGQPVNLLSEGEPLQIDLQFDEAAGRVFGFGGVNRYSGPFELKDGFQLTFGNLMSTLMAGPNLDVEQQYLEVLREVDNFTLSEDGTTLSLNKARMAPLARFQLK